MNPVVDYAVTGFFVTYVLASAWCFIVKPIVIPVLEVLLCVLCHLIMFIVWIVRKVLCAFRTGEGVALNERKVS